MTDLLRKWPRVKSGEMYVLVQQFNEKFGDRERFYEVDLIRWVREQGYEPNPYFHPMIKTLSKAGQKKRMGEKAFRIKNCGWHRWEKESITTEILLEVQTETRIKAENAVTTGVARHNVVREVLSTRHLDQKEQLLVQLANQAMQMAQTISNQMCKFSDNMITAMNELSKSQLRDGGTEETQPTA
jgi:hypothetical protein